MKKVSALLLILAMLLSLAACGSNAANSVDEDAPVLTAELPGAEDFRLCLPDEVLSDGILVLVRADGDWVCLEGQTEG